MADARGDWNDRGVKGYADLLVSPFYDGDYNTGNNWNNLDDIALNYVFGSNAEDAFDPYVYYSVVWLEDYWVVTYGFYHARDWAPELILPLSEIAVCRADCHENDYEAAIFVVSRENREVVSAHSVAHYAFKKYHNLNGLTPTVFIDDRTHAVELNLGNECIDYGLESGLVGPGASRCDDCKDFFAPGGNVVYQPIPINSEEEPSIDVAEIGIDNNDHLVGTGRYELVDIFGTDVESLNNYRFDTNIFTPDGNFHNEDTEGPESGTGSAPWGLGKMSYFSKQLEYVTCFAETGNFACFPFKIWITASQSVTINPPPYQVNIDYNPFFPCDGVTYSEAMPPTYVATQDNTELVGNGIWEEIPFNEIRIQAGAKLTIKDTQMNFKNGGRITVKPGGELIVNNSILGYCGTAVDGQWQGIKVEKGVNAATVTIENNSDILDAEVGVDLNSGENLPQYISPIVDISGSAFIDNGIGIRAVDCDGEATITTTAFSEGIGIELTNSQNFTIDNCSFSNHSTGISSSNSAFEVINESSFENCGIGVISVGTFPLGSSVYIGDENAGSGNIFDGTDRGILLLGTNSPDGAFIEKNEFRNTRHAIEFNGANKFTVANNRFMGNSRAVTMDNTGIAVNDLRCNEYVGCTQVNNLFVGENIRTRFLENHSIERLGWGYVMLDAALPFMIGENGESAANCFGESANSFLPDIASSQPFNYFYSESMDCKTEPSVGNNNVMVTEVLEEGVYCEEIGPFNIENPGSGNGGQIDLQNFEAESACRPCILDSINLYIDKVVVKGGDNPRTVAFESGPATSDLRSTERTLDQWIDFGIYVGLKLKKYEYLENILSPMKTWDLQAKHFGIKMMKNDLAGAQTKLASMSANNTKQVYFKEVQLLNLKYLRGFDRENELTATDLQRLIDIADSKTSVSGYAKGLFFQMTGTYLESEYPELEEMAKNMKERAKKKEAITSRIGDEFIRVFPNPATDRLEIVSSGDRLISTCVLIDLNGSIILQKSVNKNSLTLDLQDTVSGMYLVKIIDENGNIIIEKVIVNN